MIRLLKNVALISTEILVLPLLFVAALLSRMLRTNGTIGLGPEPLINNIYHVKALRKNGWKAESFVDSVYYITQEFDVKLMSRRKLVSIFMRLTFFTFIFSVFRYSTIYIYFNGGGLLASRLIWVLEPLLYKVAGVKTVVMPYGGDVQDMQKSPNIYFKHALDRDYPNHFRRRTVIRMKVALWSRSADHVISGCDWVDYMQHWDTLCISHFSIDLAMFAREPARRASVGPLKILHAPNHKTIKGTAFFEQAVANLQSKGVPVELVMVQGMPNVELRKLMSECDVVADQLVIGWYAMFAIEAMAMCKPVLCFVRDDLEELYVRAGLLDRDELPLVRCSPATVEWTIEELVNRRAELGVIGNRGRQYVERRHSLEVIGTMFGNINERIGLLRTDDWVDSKQQLA